MNKIETEDYKIWIEDGIIFLDFPSNITYEIVDTMIKARHSLSKGKSYHMLADITKMKHWPREARQRIAQKDSAEGTLCVAVVINSKIQVILFNFFNSIYKAPRPTKLFRNRDLALKWILEQKEIYGTELPDIT